MIAAMISPAPRPPARVDARGRRVGPKPGTTTSRVDGARSGRAARAEIHRLAPWRRRLAPLRAVDSDDATSPAPSRSYVVPGRPVNPGLYCDWSVTDADVAEVWAYRVSLSVVALSVLACSSRVFIATDPVGADGGSDPSWLDAAYFTGAAGLGVALRLIHMYVDPIKKFMQSLYAVGLAGSVGVAALASQNDGGSVPAYVVTHPAAVWAVGPMFAALTGVAFKEGMCYGKAECALLFFVIPATLLSHLTGLANEGVEKGLLGAWCVLIAVFAARKYTQEVKDDIGDKSVFIFNDLGEDEKTEWVSRARARDPARFARMSGE